MNLDRTFAIFTAPKRDSRHWVEGTVTWAEIVEWMASPGTKKEAGNYLLGTLKRTTTMHDRTKPEEMCSNFHRRKEAVVSRSAITLDVDHPGPDFADAVELAFPYAVLMHTTFSSTPDDPRYRLIIPTDRELLPDEYITAARSIMQLLGEDSFDKSSSEPERYMFRPAAQEPKWFSYNVVDGDPAPVEWLLESFEADLSDKEAPARAKRDPFEIGGTIGAFNKAYEDWDLLIETYELPYEKVDEDRYHLIGAASQAGMGPVRDVAGFVYSHHANDPAFGKTCSAFDLVRLHLFGDLDEKASPQTPVNKLPSHQAMLELAVTDHRVIAQLVGTDFEAEMNDLLDGDEDDESDAGDWKMKLRLQAKTGAILDVIHNWDLIRDNDRVLESIYYNELSLSAEATWLPWRDNLEDQPEIREYDRLEFHDYLERTYGLRTTRGRADALLDVRAGRRHVNPIKDYLQGLVWDGYSRLETCLPGVRATDFTRRVARMSLVAAVARMLEPGCKYDHTLVLYGNEGLGKSWWINRMARGHSSSLGRIDNKDTLLVMQRSWIMVADEGHSLRKADSDAMKEFLTETKDVFRMPYDRETIPHPRRCVIWSTTNDETFLRRQQGNRRFLIVHCEDKVDFDRYTDDYVDQIWAEAVHLYNNGEQLWLDDDGSVEAAIERERFVEEDSLAGLIQEFLDQLVPLDWWAKSPEQRVAWMSDRDQGFEPEGETIVNRTCSLQIWVEAMGRRKGDHRRVDLLEITEAVKRIPGWEVESGRHRIPGYGPQLTFIRTEGEDLL